MTVQKIGLERCSSCVFYSLKSIVYKIIDSALLKIRVLNYYRELFDRIGKKERG